MTEKFQHHTDSELLELFKKSSNNQYLGTLLNRYNLLVFGVCMKYLKNPEEAQDTAQQVFEKVISEIKKYEIPYFKSWLYSVTKNQCLMQLRKTHSKLNISEKHFEEFDIEATQDLDLQLNEEYLATRITQLNEALEKLNSEQSTCITLFYLKRLSYREIEKKTGFSFQQIKSHIQNGKRNLSIMLNDKLKK